MSPPPEKGKKRDSVWFLHPVYSRCCMVHLMQDDLVFRPYDEWRCRSACWWIQTLNVPWSIDPAGDHPVEELVVTWPLGLRHPPYATLWDGADPHPPFPRHGPVLNRLPDAGGRGLENLLHLIGERCAIEHNHWARLHTIQVVELGKQNTSFDSAYSEDQSITIMTRKYFENPWPAPGVRLKRRG